MTSGMNYKQRDIILLPFPYSDLSSSKRRPALVLSNNSFNNSSQDIICCLITTNPKHDNLSVSINETDVENGRIHYKSRIKPYRIFTADKESIIRKLCDLNEKKFDQTIETISRVISKN